MSNSNFLFSRKRREKELWHNKILSSTTHQQNHRNYLQENEAEKVEALEIYDVSMTDGL